MLTRVTELAQDQIRLLTVVEFEPGRYQFVFEASADPLLCEGVELYEEAFYGESDDEMRDLGYFPVIKDSDGDIAYCCLN